MSAAKFPARWQGCLPDTLLHFGQESLLQSKCIYHRQAPLGFTAPFYRRFDKANSGRVDMKKQSSVGVWVMGFGKLLLVTVLVVCVVDIAGLESRGGLLDSLPGYLTAIMIGVAMQFVGAAIPNMKFTTAAK